MERRATIKCEVGYSSKKQRAMTRYEVGSSSKKQRKGMKYIPRDIIEQIQLRLPAKSIVRFRLVSKLWFTVSSDASFIQTHLNFINKNPLLELAENPSSNKIEIYEKGFFKCDLWMPKSVNYPERRLVGHSCGGLVCMHRNEKGLFDYYTPLPVNYPDNRLVGSCNGLVCMYGNEEIVVFNPVTRESISLPNATTGKSYNWPSRQRKWNFAFGFNPNTNEHKVIYFYQEENPKHTECKVEVCTLGKDISSWRQIEGGAPVAPFDEAINIGAIMYWKFGFGDISILFFDLSKEKFGQIEAPKEEYYKSLIMDLNGRLCWVSINLPHRKRMLNLWTLDDENKSNWTLSRVIQLWGASIHHWSPLSLWYVKNSQKNKKRMIIELGDTRWNEYYCLDLTIKNGCVEKVQSDLLLNSNLLVRADCAYVESLLPLP